MEWDGKPRTTTGLKEHRKKGTSVYLRMRSPYSSVMIDKKESKEAVKRLTYDTRTVTRSSFI